MDPTAIRISCKICGRNVGIRTPLCSRSFHHHMAEIFYSDLTIFGLQGLRYRERGPMKSWRSETMAEAIWSVLQEGLSMSQAARKHDIPYPTFVLYANRVHNMLGPSPLNGYGMGGE